MLGRMIFLPLFGGIFVVVGLAVIWFMGARTTLVCERPEPRTGECRLATTNALGLNGAAQTLPLNELQRAELETSVDDEDNSETYRVVLRTEMGAVPFTGYFSSGESGKRQVADQINAFLEDKAARDLSVSQDDGFFALLFGGLFAGVGGLVAVGGLLAPLGRLFGR